MNFDKQLDVFSRNLSEIRRNGRYSYQACVPLPFHLFDTQERAVGKNTPRHVCLFAVRLLYCLLSSSCSRSRCCSHSHHSRNRPSSRRRSSNRAG